MRWHPQSPFGKAWVKVVNDIRSQNTEKTEEELKWIIGVEYHKFYPRWDTYTYTR
jgi:hypothetical protein